MIIAGDSTQRQLFFAVTALFMALGEKGLIVPSKDKADSTSADSTSVVYQLSPLSDPIGEHWTSEQWLSWVAADCPRGPIEWKRNMNMYGGRCTYGTLPLVSYDRGMTTTPVIRGMEGLVRLATTSCDGAASAAGLEEHMKRLEGNGSDQRFKPSKNRALVVTNFRTLHLTHAFPYRPFENFVVEQSLSSPSSFKAALKADLLAILSTLEPSKGSTGANTLVYRTVNAVCGSATTVDYDRAYSAYTRGAVFTKKGGEGNYTVADCDEYVESSFPGASWSENGACLDTFLAMSGVERFWRLEVEVVGEIMEERREKEGKEGGGVGFFLLDAMELTKDNCEFAPDGRHFQKLNYLQLFVLAKALVPA